MTYSELASSLQELSHVSSHASGDSWFTRHTSMRRASMETCLVRTALSTKLLPKHLQEMPPAIVTLKNLGHHKGMQLQLQESDSLMPSAWNRKQLDREPLKKKLNLQGRLPWAHRLTKIMGQMQLAINQTQPQTAAWQVSKKRATIDSLAFLNPKDKL